MYCAECGNKKERRLDGAWNVCCNGFGYWSKVIPLPKDVLWPVVKHKDFYFYFNNKWPAGKQPTIPNEHSN